MPGRTVVRRAVGCAVAILACATAAAGGVARRPPRGHFKMAPELVGKHPRLHFTRADVPRLKRKAAGPSGWFLDRAAKSFGGRLGNSPNVKKMPHWERYLYGFWGLFAADMLATVRADARALAAAKHWTMWLARERWWLKDDLAEMDALSGLALSYDILYDRLTEAERAEVRKALWDGIEFISKRFFVGQYWTADFQNNHMHNRVHALAHAAFALHGDDAAYDCRPHADLALACIEGIVEWLPEDGSTHEGPGYWSYGHHWVERAVALASHVTGTDYAARNPHFANSHWYAVHMAVPGWSRCFDVGDGGGLSNLTPVALTVAHAKDPLGHGFLRELMKRRADGFYQHAAWGLLWHEPGLEAESIDGAPLSRLWPDLDMLSARSSWRDDATAFVFKCGPPGGHKMQRLREGGAWVNVAHDHPDQNHFMIWAHGTMLAEDDGYPRKKKLARSHNTLVIDGKGQPREGTGWYQPFDYKLTGFMEDAFTSGDTAYAAGNASRCYEGAERFVRHVAFVGGEYAIAVDDLAGAGGGKHEFEWRLHKKGDWKEAAPGRFGVADGDVSLDIRFLAPDPARLTSKFLPAELTAKPCLAVSQRAREGTFVAVLVPRKGGLPRREAKLVKTSARGSVAVRTTDREAEDIFAVSFRGSRALVAADVEAKARAVIVRRSGKADVELALIVNGTSLDLGGRTLLGASRAANVSFRRTKTGARVDAEAPYRRELAKTSLRIGGLAPRARYSVTVDAGRAAAKTADASGVVTIDVDLSERRAIELAR